MEQQEAFKALVPRQKFCGECGAPNEMESTICKVCGSPLESLEFERSEVVGGLAEKEDKMELKPTDAFATGLASWDLVPPQTVIRRKKRGNRQ
jgi:ribosomal protein L40E